MKDRGPRILGAALVVLLSVWGGVKLHSYRRAQQGVPVPAGESSAPGPQDSALPESLIARTPIPSLLPEFALQDLAGKSTPISTWGGKSLMINFWATWCAPCLTEIPLLKALASDWAARDLTVVGIAVDHPEQVKAFVLRFKIDYPILIGDQDALDLAAKFGMDSPAFPFTVFTDRRGEVVALFVGELHRPEADFILSEVQNLNAERVQLPEARRRIAEGIKQQAGKEPG